jgi:hypothetical protein
VNGAWHSIYPFDAEKQDVSRKGKITVRPPIRHLSRLLASFASRKPINSGHTSQIMVHRTEHVFQGPHSRSGAGPMLMRMLISGLGRRGRAVVLKENLPRRKPPLPSSQGMTSFVGARELVQIG